MKRRRRCALPVEAGLLAILALAACSPLPGPALDPLYLGRGTRTDKPQEVLTSSAEDTPPASAPASDASLWTGRYRDSRGEGEITLSVVRGKSSLGGTWQLRTGGGGPITAVLESEGTRFQLRMENVGPDCPGVFEGWAEISETTLVAAYHGKDCAGTISDGRLELHHR